MSTRSSIPFPLASGRYEVGPAMRRFGQGTADYPAEEGHFQPDERLAETLAAKLQALQRAPGESHLIARDADLPSLSRALQESFRLLAAEHPAIATADDSGLQLHLLGLRLTGWSRLDRVGEPWPAMEPVADAIAAWLAGQEGIDLLGNLLGLAVQEDLALVRGPAEADQLEWLHVCLPSNWSPAEKVGRSFAAVHEPVVHTERLVNSRRQIVTAMIHGGPFVRYVWGIHRDGELCHNPRIHQAPPWPTEATPAELAQTAWFRVERQTTHGFPGLDRSLFTIRYWVEPLAVTDSDAYRRERLAAALAAMSPEELQYKGLTEARDGLVSFLTRPDTRTE